MQTKLLINGKLVAGEGKVEEVLKYQASTLEVTAPEKLTLFRMEMEAVDKLKRIYALAKRITRAILPRDIAWKAAE